MRRPRQIVTDISSHCNLKCTYCPTSDPKSPFKPGYMQTDLVISIVDRIKQEKLNSSITSNLLGEALFHLDILYMYKYMVKSKVPFYLTTNSTLWYDEVFDLLTDNNSCYQIILSNNGLFHEKSHSLEKCMPGINRKESKRNIQLLLRMRNRKRSNTQIGIKITQRGQDYEEIEELICYWLHEMKVDFVAVGKLLVNNNTGMRIFPCRYSDDFALEIRSDGTAIGCGWNTEVTNELKVNFGKVPLTGSLVEFYNNKKYHDFRKAHYLGKFPDVCRRCSISYTGDRFIGTVYFRNKRFPRRKIYYHEDYSNIFYSYKPRHSRVSFLRDWRPDQEIVDEILRENKKLYWR